MDPISNNNGRAKDKGLQNAMVNTILISQEIDESTGLPASLLKKKSKMRHIFSLIYRLKLMYPGRDFVTKSHEYISVEKSDASGIRMARQALYLLIISLASVIWAMAYLSMRAFK